MNVVVEGKVKIVLKVQKLMSDVPWVLQRNSFLICPSPTWFYLPCRAFITIFHFFKSQFQPVSSVTNLHQLRTIIQAREDSARFKLGPGYVANWTKLELLGPLWIRTKSYKWQRWIYCTDMFSSRLVLRLMFPFFLTSQFQNYEIVSTTFSHQVCIFPSHLFFW